MRIIILLAAAAATPAAAQTEAAPATPAAAVPANEAKVELSTGLDYQQGEYGTGERIETLSVQNGLRVTTGRVTLSASLPWQRIEGPGNAVGGGGLLGLPIVVDPTRPATRTARSGIGDARLGAAYAIPQGRLGGVGLALTGQVKLPTASREKGLGTGETDYAVGAEASTTLGGVTPFASVAYTMPGDPEGFELRNGLSARAGVAAPLSNGVRGHVAYGYAQSLSPLVPDEQQIGAGLNAAVGNRLSVGVYGSAGLSEGSPDVGAGLSLGLRL